MTKAYDDLERVRDDLAEALEIATGDAEKPPTDAEQKEIADLRDVLDLVKMKLKLRYPAKGYTP